MTAVKIYKCLLELRPGHCFHQVQIRWYVLLPNYRLCESGRLENVILAGFSIFNQEREEVFPRISRDLRWGNKTKKKTSELTSIQELNINLSKYSAAVCLFCAGINFD